MVCFFEGTVVFAAGFFEDVDEVELAGCSGTKVRTWVGGVPFWKRTCF